MQDEAKRKHMIERLENLNVAPNHLLRVIPAPIQIKINDKIPLLPFNNKPTFSFIEQT